MSLARDPTCTTLGKMPTRGYPFQRIRTALLLAVGLISILSLTSCVTMTDLEASQEQAKMQVGVITSPGETIEQSFISHRGRLNGITLWLSSGGEVDDPPTSTTEISLLSEPPGDQPLFIEIYSITGSREIAISLPVQSDQPDQTYRVRVRSLAGPVQVLGMDLDLYPGGQAYINGQPIDSDIAFRSSYDYAFSSAVIDLTSILKLSWLVLPLAGMLLLPGWLVLDLLGIRRKFERGQLLGLSVGLSLALIPLIMLWTTVLGLHWTKWGVRFTFGVLAALGAWRLWRSQFWKIRRIHLDWVLLGLIAVNLGTVILRFAMLRDLPAPAWVDSIHHALITRLIIENGGFPSTYQPYFDLGPAEYHTGFHSGLAVFQWLSGVNLPQSLLIYGQVLNVLAVLAVYLLTSSLTGSRKAALAAGLITAFFTPMPAYYASWGRYTQLAGLLVLPAAFALFVKAINISPTTISRPKKLVRYILPLALCSAGLLIIHYRAAVFFALLAAAYLLSRFKFEKTKFKRWIKIALSLAGMPAVITLLLAMPWILPNLKDAFLPGLAAGGTPGLTWFSDHSWSFLTAGLGIFTIWLALAGWMFAFARARRTALTILFWISSMLIMANFGAMRLPFSALISTSSVEIMLFMPISVLAGYLLAEGLKLIATTLSAAGRRIVIGAGIAGLIGLSIFGASRLLSIINPVTLLVRQADLQAMEWIESNLSEDQTVLINPFNWGYGAYAGHDGGYWISPLTGRRTMPPPVLFGFGEAESIQHILDASRKTEEVGSDPDALWEHMQSLGIRYVYIGARGGPLWVPGLLASEKFQLQYQQNGVFIFITRP